MTIIRQSVGLISYGGLGVRVPVPSRLAYPDLSSGGAMFEAEHELGKALRGMPIISKDRLYYLVNNIGVMMSSDKSVGAFADDLIPYLPPRVTLPDYEEAVSRSIIEQVASSKVYALRNVKADLNSTADLMKFIRVHMGLLPSFRQRSVSTMPDIFNNVVDYPNFRMLPSLIDDIDSFRRQHGKSRPYCTAVVTLVAIVHAHPFTDGNGRTARAIFNLLASVASSSEICLPLSVISMCSNGSFILKLRRAMHGAEWYGLIRFITEACRLCTRIYNVNFTEL